MQGGCSCENCCYLRVGTGNIEIAALTAPRPLGMLAADDWTKELATKGYPELRQLYSLLGVPDRVMMKPLVQFPHNYNFVSREVMYHWMNRQLKLGLPEPIIEEDFKPLTTEEASVWDADHPKPAGGPEHERALLRWMTADAQKQVPGVLPAAGDAGADQQLTNFRRIVGGAWEAMIGRELPAPDAVKFAESSAKAGTGWRETAGLIRYAAEKEELPAMLLTPEHWNNQVAVWIDATGKAGLHTSGGLKPAVQKLLDGGVAVLGVDLLYQGEFLADGKPLTKTRRVTTPKDSRDAACFTYGYNLPVFAERVRDVLSAIAAAGALPHDSAAAGPPDKRHVYLIGLEGGGAWTVAAAVVAGDAVAATAIDTGGFRFAKVRSIDDPDFLPGAAKYLDLPGLLALASQRNIWIAGESGPTANMIQASASGGTGKLTMYAGSPEKTSQHAVEWLLRNAPKD